MPFINLYGAKVQQFLTVRTIIESEIRKDNAI